VDPSTLRQDIRIEGLSTHRAWHRVCLLFLIDQYSDDKGSSAIRLFGLGLFSDVRLQVNGDVLVVIVEERPFAVDVFSGIRVRCAEEVLKSRCATLASPKAGRLDKALADRAEQGTQPVIFPTAASTPPLQVVTTVTPADRNQGASTSASSKAT
jgi:outer membrane protein insertion porin family